MITSEGIANEYRDSTHFIVCGKLFKMYTLLNH